MNFPHTPNFTLPKTSAIALLSTGEGVRFYRLAYVDEAAQAVHQGIYDASIIQAIGRARGLNRTAANPVEIRVFASCPLPMPAASITRWGRPSRLSKMLWRGIVPLSAAGMARRYPEMFPSDAAARTAKSRWGGEAVILHELRPLADGMPGPSAIVTLQLAGQGQKRTRLIVARDRVEALRHEAEHDFGGLVSWHVEPFSRGRRPLKATAEECDALGKRKISFAQSVTVLSGRQPAPVPPAGRRLEDYLRHHPPDG